MAKYIIHTLEDWLQKARLNPYLLVVRVNLVNQLVSSTLWYMLQLWTGDWEQLELFDRMLRDFIWSGQDFSKNPRVDYLTINVPRTRVDLDSSR